MSVSRHKNTSNVHASVYRSVRNQNENKANIIRKALYPSQQILSESQPNKIDLIFEKQPPQVQKKLMNLLIQYNAMMKYNKEEDRFEVDLLFPFESSEQKKQFIRKFQSRHQIREQSKKSRKGSQSRQSEDSNKQRSQSRGKERSKQIERAQYRTSNQNVRPQSRNNNRYYSDQGVKQRQAQQMDRQQQISYDFTQSYANQNDYEQSHGNQSNEQGHKEQTGVQLKQRLLREVQFKIRDKIKGAIISIKNKSIKGNTREEYKLEDQNIQKQVGNFKQLNTNSNQNPSDYNNIFKQNAASNNILDQDIIGNQQLNPYDDYSPDNMQQGDDYIEDNIKLKPIQMEVNQKYGSISNYRSLHPNYLPQDRRDNNQDHNEQLNQSDQSSEIKNQILIEDIQQDQSNLHLNDGEGNQNFSQLEHSTQKKKKKQDQSEDNFNQEQQIKNYRQYFTSFRNQNAKNPSMIKPGYNYKRNQPSVFQSGNSYQQGSRRSSESRQRQNSNVKRLKQRLTDRYGSKKQPTMLNKKYQQFFKRNHQQFNKIYEKIRKQIRRTNEELKTKRTKNQDPILVLEQNISELDSQQDRFFRQEIIKDYQKHIIAHNENMSSEDLVRYFRYLLQNAKGLYIKHLKRGR